jgi:HK97 family phage portal protein
MKFSFKNVWNKLFSRGNEIKSASVETIASTIQQALSGFSENRKSLSVKETIFYYTTVSAVYKAINLLSKEFSSIVPLLQDKSNNKFVANNPVNDLLSKPNADITRFELFQELSSYYLISGNTYLMAIGNVNKPPLELFTIRPQNVSIDSQGNSSYVQSYKVSLQNGDKVVFKPKEVNGLLRYINSDGRELWHIRMFNPSGDKFKGLSPLEPIFSEVEQLRKSNTHNLSTLVRGARLSGILNPEQPLSDVQRKQLDAQLKELISGSENAGRILVAEGGKISFKEMSQTNKDMDFANLKKDITSVVYNNYDIPLPLISMDAMTYSNYAIALLALYDNAVLPLANRFYEELTRFLLPRYNMDIGKLRIFYNTIDISALEPRRIEKAKAYKETEATSKNEIRNILGLPDVEGGNVIYVPSNLVPMGTNPLLIKQPEPTKAKFAMIMRNILNPDGSRRFTDEEIIEMAEEEGLIGG